MAQPSGTGVTFKVTVQPKAYRNKVGGYETGTLRLRVTAPPHDGKANEAVVSLLAESLDVAKSQVRIVRGHSSRQKTISVESLTLEELQSRLKAFEG